MASRIPLPHLKNLNIKLFTFKSDILAYTLDNGLQIQTYFLIYSNEISKFIENLNKNRLLCMVHKKLIMQQKIF